MENALYEELEKRQARIEELERILNATDEPEPVIYESGKRKWDNIGIILIILAICAFTHGVCFGLGRYYEKSHYKKQPVSKAQCYGYILDSESSCLKRYGR